MRYFVTGATGFLGGAVVRGLLEGGHEVTALIRSRSRAEALAAAGVRLAEGDVTESESLRRPMAGCDGVFHIAGWFKVGVRDRGDAERVNVAGTRSVLAAMRDLRIPRGVYTSTLAVNSDTGGRIVDEAYRHDGPHLSEYDRTKWLAHHEVAAPMIAAGLPLIIAQPGGIYGPGDMGPYHQAFVQYLRRRLPIVPRDAGLCWGYIDDVARGHLLAMERGRPGETYILAGPRHTYVEVFALAERLTGIPAPRVRPGPGVLRALARAAGAVERLLPLPPDYRAERLRVLAGVTYYGTSAKAQRELGFTARPLDAGLRETLSHEMRALGRTPPRQT